MTTEDTVILGVIGALKTFFVGDSPAVLPDDISRWRDNSFTDPVQDTPTLVIRDFGESIPECDDGVKVRYLMPLELQLTAKRATIEDAHVAIATAVAAIQIFCESNRVGGDCVDVQYRSTQGVSDGPADGMSKESIVITVRYVRDYDAPVNSPSALTPVWGTEVAEYANDLLLARLTELISQMATGYDPKFNQIFDHHLVANIQPNSITLGMVRRDETDMFSAIYVAEHEMIFSIRVHTGFNGQWQDTLKQTRLLESVENKLRAKKILAPAASPRSQTEVWSIGPSQVAQVFEDTNTIGGAIAVTIRSVVEHTQE